MPNAARSGGPRTAAGKAASSRNAVKHGLTGRHPVIDVEDHAEYLEFLDAFFDQYEPRTPVEQDLVTEMANARWRMRRALAIETAIFNHQAPPPGTEAAAPPADNIERHALSFGVGSDPTRALDRIHRYETRLRRQYERALREFNALRSAAGRDLESEIAKYVFAPLPSDPFEPRVQNEQAAARPETAAAAPPPPTAARAAADPALRL